jgi:hypothetical protein
MMTSTLFRAPAIALALVGAGLLAGGAPSALAAKSTACAKINVCYCFNDDLKTLIESKVATFRALIAAQRQQGKAIGYLSVPLSTTGGGYMGVNMEVAQHAKAQIEQRFGSLQIWVLNPGMLEAELPAGSSGADYMVMWTALLEGAEGFGEDFDFVYFVGPGDFARFFAFDGRDDMAKVEVYFERRLASDPDLEKAAQGGLTKSAFRNYYALKASIAFSRGAHDEWNIFRLINERRRSDPRYGIGNQLPVLFDGLAASPADSETAVAGGYAGACPR